MSAPPSFTSDDEASPHFLQVPTPLSYVLASRPRMTAHHRKLVTMMSLILSLGANLWTRKAEGTLEDTETDLILQVWHCHPFRLDICPSLVKITFEAVN